MGAGLIAQVELGQSFALMLHHPGEKRVAAGRDVGLDRPVFLGLEALDLDFSVDHQAQGHRLHPSGRSRSRQLAPQHRRKREADQIVQSAAGEVGLDQLHIDITRVLHRLGDGGLCDGVEHHPFNLRALDGFLLLQNLKYVPGNGLTLAVGVGGQDDAFGALGGVGNVVQTLGGFGIDVPQHLEIFVGLYRSVLSRQVADMAVGG